MLPSPPPVPVPIPHLLKVAGVTFGLGLFAETLANVNNVNSRCSVGLGGLALVAGAEPEVGPCHLLPTFASKTRKRKQREKNLRNLMMAWTLFSVIK